MSDGKMGADGKRRYGRHHHHGLEDTGRCVREIRKPGGYSYYSQCSRERGHGKDGLYCKQHDPEAEKAKRDANYAAFQAKVARKAAPYTNAAAFRKALQEIADGHNDPRELARRALAEAV